MRKYFFFIFFAIFCGRLSAQELPITNHAIQNPYFYNPAFAGYENRPAVYLGYRNQWTGIEGAPTTSYINFHSIAAKVIPFGVNIYSDQRSILSTTHALLSVGFRARFEEDDHYLSFGLSGGAGFNTVDLSAINNNTANDPALANLLEDNIVLDGNAGLAYHNHGFNFGISFPKIFQTKPVDTTSFSSGVFGPLSTGIAMMGYKWKVNPENFSIEPWVIYYYFQDRTGQLEASTTFHIKDVIWIGGSYRLNYGASAFLGFNIKDNFKLGYNYEFAVSPVDNFNNNSHEVTLGIIFGKSKKDKRTSFYQRRRRMLTTMRASEEEEKTTTPARPQQNLYKVENDPFEKEKPETTPKEEPAEEPTQTEEEVDLDEFMKGFEDEEAEEKKDTVQQKSGLIDRRPQQATKKPAPAPKPEEKEETFDPLSTFDAVEDEVTTRDEEGIYIGPTTVQKGDHLLELEKGYYVVVGTFNSYRGAEEYSDELFIKGFYTKFGYISQTTDYYTYIFHSADNKQECVDTMERLRTLADFREIWVLTVE